MFNIYSGFVMPKCKVFDGAYNAEGFINEVWPHAEFAATESHCFSFDMSATFSWR